MSTSFPLLGSPGQLGPLQLKNRIVLLPHGLFYAERSALLPTERHVDYYEARARGGVGLVCVESSVVSLDGQQGAPLVLSSDPRCIEGYARIAEAVHRHGARVCGQLTHYGNQAHQLTTRAPLIGPSRLPDLASREPAVAMSRADLDRVREQFAAGARNLASAGFDAVEIKAAHDGLLRQFLSPACNDRQDEYGGSVENRVRYPLEVAASVRQAIGAGLALSVRLTLDECVQGGYGLEEGIAFARAFEDSSLFDVISPDIGIWASVEKVVAPMPTEEGYAQHAFGALAEAVQLPIIACGRICTPEYGERLLAEGMAHAIGMARQLIADPDFAEKALSGQARRIRPCTACNQLCVGNSMKLLPLSCTVNPRVGFGERARGRAMGLAGLIAVVVGGGPAGMEAARALAGAGASVTLFERDQLLGGRLTLAAETGRRTGWGRYLHWLEAELREVGVGVRLGVEAHADVIAACEPSLVVIACGASPPPPAIGGSITLEAFLRQRTVAERVALLDRGAAGPALWFSALEAGLRGAREVSIVTPTPVVGGDLDGPTFIALRRELAAAGVHLHTDSFAARAQDGSLQILNVYGGEGLTVEADLIVTSEACEPDGVELERQLRQLRLHTVRIGDALAPRDASAAIREGEGLVEAVMTDGGSVPAGL